jgi:glycerol-3-phosphate dehydrogenase
MLGRLRAEPKGWDFIVIGGGATGVSIALDAASRGYKTVLVEQHDFSKGTSSRSTKLVHGGVRYLQQGNVSLVYEALHERGLLRRNAPHLVHDLAFVVPNYKWWAKAFYGIGLKVYDVMAGKYGFGHSRLLNRRETIERIPTIEQRGLRGGVLYHDGQFDDSRLNVNIAQTAVEHGAAVANYMRVTALLKEGGMVRGARVQDEETGETHELWGKVVVNATGAFTDGVRRMEDPAAKPMVSPSQGVHIVLPKRFLPGDSAIMVPHTDDGRVLFAIPWHDCVVLGTTDTAVPEATLEPAPFQEELNFLLVHAARYLAEDPTPDDVLSAFVGIRPLVSSHDKGSTAALSRDHTIHISKAGLLTIAGGKWTTCRRMAEDAVNQGAKAGGMNERPCITKQLNIHGYHKNAAEFGPLERYGSDAPAIKDMIRQEPELGERLHPELPFLLAQVVWAVREEMARTVEDVLSRRARALIIDAKTSIKMAPKVASIIARELGRDEAWQRSQVEEYTALAQQYIVGPAAAEREALPRADYPATSKVSRG